MGLLISTVLIAAAFVAAPNLTSEEREYRAEQIHMGVSFKIVLYASDSVTANRGIQAAFARIAQLDQIMSDYDSDSELNHLSSASPTREPIVVSDDLFQVLQQAVSLSKKTEGAFDITVGPLTKLWRRARRQKKMPSQQRVHEALAAVGYQQLRLDANRKTAELLRPHMRLDLGGIAKGYAADQALRELRKRGLCRALVNGSGDIAIGESPPGLLGWKIGVAPLGPQAGPSQFLILKNCGIATSGDAWQYVEIDGKRYSHILDPRTGMSLTDHSGVSVIAPNCTLADSLASAVSVLGPDDGIRLIEQTPNAAAIVIRVTGEKIKIYRSNRFRSLVSLP